MSRRTRKIYYPNLTAELARRGYAICDLGDYLGLTRFSIYNIVSGKTNVNLIRMKKILSFFEDDNLTLDYLFYHKDED